MRRLRRHLRRSSAGAAKVASEIDEGVIVFIVRWWLEVPVDRCLHGRPRRRHVRRSRSSTSRFALRTAPHLDAPSSYRPQVSTSCRAPTRAGGAGCGDRASRAGIPASQPAPVAAAMVTTATIAHTVMCAPVRLMVAHMSAPKRNTAKIAPQQPVPAHQQSRVFARMSAGCVRPAAQVKGHR